MALLKANKKNSNWRLSLYHKVLLIITLIAICFCAQGIYREAKAIVAQRLLSLAWVSHLEDGERHKPWPWADSVPIAQLTIAGQGPLMVVAGTSISHLTLAPAWMVSSSGFGKVGNSVVVAHNDTHFKQLKEVHLNSLLTVNTYPNLQFNYRVIATKIVNEKELSVLKVSEQEILTLITCYPFESSLLNSELRFVVVAKRIKQPFSDIKFAWLN
ncbi:class GN sortase [Psychromonas sp. MB-3u-54]|uniref:class GN sortase n=1 Tax=Psychromonas sp. MB-3u-54 TaxID=2058319 RepID=UPI000C343168|nr:class GN sortase [Psychromonas sp. MB-3u-54]PKH01510.1 class GN sortase [Psychromonas sp. MB-3u-54]